MKKSKSQSGSIHLIVIVALIIIVLSILGFKFWSAINENNINNSNADNYSNYLRDKYSFNNDDIKLISYDKAHTEYVASSVFGHPYEYDIPDIAKFKVKETTVMVVNNNSNLSDDYQIKEISDLSSAYFSKILGLNVNFTEFRYGNDGDAIDFALSDYLQNSWKEVISANNIENFLANFGNYKDESAIFRGTINLYVKINMDEDIDSLTATIDQKAMQFINKTQLDKFCIWFYSDDNGLEIKSSNPKEFFINNFKNYYVANLNGIKARIIYVDPTGNNRLGYTFDKKGNFYIDNQGMWFGYANS